MSIKIACTVWPWTMEAFRPDVPRDVVETRFAEAVRSVSYLGYRYLENMNFLLDLYGEDPARLRELLERSGMQLVALYHMHTGGPAQDYLERGERSCRLLAALGGDRLIVQPRFWSDPPYYRPTDREQIDFYLDLFGRMAEISAEYGVTTCLHPHGASCLLTAEQLDYFYERADTKKLRMALDTAHIALGGLDPVAAVERYHDLIAYLHLMDLDPDENRYTKVPDERFLPLGQGGIDFRGLFAALEKYGYDGYASVENSRPRICNFESAQFSRLYLRALLGQ